MSRMCEVSRLKLILLASSTLLSQEWVDIQLGIEIVFVGSMFELF